MRIHPRKTPRWRSVLPAVLLPVSCLGMAGIYSEHAWAQTSNEQPVAATQDTKPQQPAQPPASGAPVIGEIIVIGNKTLNEVAIVAMSGYKVGDPCTDQAINEMQRNLILTGNFGFHTPNPNEAVKVVAEETNPPSGKCKVTIEVDENPTVNSVQITGSGPIKLEEVRNLIHVTEGKSVFNLITFERDMQDVQELYRGRGYTVSPGPDTGPDLRDPSILNVSLIVLRVSEIKIAKATKTRRKVILREMQTKEGDYYNRNLALEDRRRLFNLDLFEDVQLFENIISADRVSLTLNLPEKRTGIISAGIGFSNRQQLIGRAEVADTNFRGMGQSLNLLWESGGAVNRSSIVLGYTEPWLDRRHTLLNVQLYDRVVFRFANNLTNSILGSGGLIGTDTRYNEQRTGAQVTLSRPFRRTYSAALTLKGENVRVDRLALTPDNARIIQNGPIISFTAYMQHNTRDLEIDPVTGNFQSISAMFGRANLKPVRDANGNEIGNALGTVNFIKTGIELRQYFSLTGPRKPTKLDEEKTSIALRLSLGTSVGTLPFFEQFFVGGVESLRGYREDRFWGNNYFLGSVEFRQPLARRLKGVVFLDIGNAWGGAYSDVRLQGFSQSGFQLRTGFGVGLRVGTPIGPVRIDLGYGAEGARTHFSIGNVF